MAKMAKTTTSKQSEAKAMTLEPYQTKAVH